MEKMFSCCAGLDVHKESVHAHVRRLEPDGQDRFRNRRLLRGVVMSHGDDFEDGRSNHTSAASRFKGREGLPDGRRAWAVQVAQVDEAAATY